MNSQTTLKNTSTFRYAGVSLSALDLKKENVLDEFHSTTSSTISQKGNTEMSKLLNEKAPVCSIYDVDSRYLAEERNLVVRGDLNGRVDVVFPVFL